MFKDHHAELASTLVHIFCQYDRVVPILTACLRKSIDKEGECVLGLGGKTVSCLRLIDFFLTHSPSLSLSVSEYVNTVSSQHLVDHVDGSVHEADG